MQNRRLHIATVGALFIAVAAAGCGGSGAGSPSTGSVSGASNSNSTPPGPVRVSTANVKGLGRVLVDSRGRTLYAFMPDKRSRVTCVSSCAAVWPPLKLASGARTTAADQAKASLLGSDRDPEGGRVVTYANWPLYTYVSDTRAGQANGQALNLNGGLWYVLSPSGQVIKTKLAASNGYGY